MGWLKCSGIRLCYLASELKQFKSSDGEITLSRKLHVEAMLHQEAHQVVLVVSDDDRPDVGN